MHKRFRRSLLVAAYFALAMLLCLHSSGVFALSDATLDRYAEKGIAFYDPSECVTSSKAMVSGGNGQTESWPGTKYELTEGQTRGLAAIANGENNYNVDTMRTEASQMANLFEQNHSDQIGDANAFVNYIKTPGGWYSDNTVAKYDESWNGNEDYIAAVSEVWSTGIRTIPPEVTQHWDIDYPTTHVYVGDQEVDKSDYSKYVRGQTIIEESAGGTRWTFYTWGDPSTPGGGDPFGYEREPTGSVEQAAADGEAAEKDTNLDYAANQIIPDDKLKTIEENKKLYVSGVAGTKVPWQLLAALHLRTSDLSMENPDKYGIFYVPGLEAEKGHENTYDEALEQAKKAAKELSNHMGIYTGDSAIKAALFKYDNPSEIYIAQARDLNYSEVEAEQGEGSPYVMNRYDAVRDPSKNDATWGYLETIDSTELIKPAYEDYGVFVLYKALGGGDDKTGICGPNNGVANGNGNMDINKTAYEIAWKPGESHSPMSPPAAYKTAYEWVSANGGYDYKRIPSGGSSCDFFVHVVYRYTGIDPTFPCCGISTAWDYLYPGFRASGYTSGTLNPNYEYIGKEPDVSLVRPGDILLQELIDWECGHIKIAVEVDGQLGEAQASNNEHSAEYSKSIVLHGRTKDNGIVCSAYHVFRHK